MSTTGRVFVNFRKEDGDWAAGRIADALSARFGADNVFLSDRSLEPGANFDHGIVNWLRTSDVVLAVIGSTWLTVRDTAGGRRIDHPDDWVRREIAQALRQNSRTTLIPVLIDSADTLSEKDLPAEIADLARKQYRRLGRHAEEDIAGLIEKVSGLLPVPPSPYRGLEPFSEEYAEFFRGRGDDTRRLLELVEQHPVVLVSGASGSGKSSLIHAGLLPELRTKNIASVVIRPVPGQAPDALLADALNATRGSGTLVVCVDQFEELTAANPAAATELFKRVTTLVDAAPERLRAVFTIRSSADLDDLDVPERAHFLQDATYFLYPLDEAGLTAAITEPAAAVSRPFEPGLADRIRRDACTAPGQLPLVEFALTLLWESAPPGVLTHKAYDNLNGVAGALATHAERVYHLRKQTGHADGVRRLLTQLVRPNDDGSFIASPVRLDHLDPDLRQEAARLSTRRLVVIRSSPQQPEVVALAHEALVREWPRLQGWLDADREFRTWQEQLRVSMRQWQESEQDQDTLLRGVQLAVASKWRTRAKDSLTAAEQDYIAASSAAEAERLAADRRRARRLRRLVVTLAVLLVATITAVIGTLVFAQTAADQRDAAVAKTAAAAADELRVSNPALAAQISLASYRLNSSPETRSSLLNTFATPYATQLRHGDNVETVTFTPDGNMLAVAGQDNTIRLWDVADPHHPREKHSWPGHSDTIWTAAFSPDGRILVTSSADQTAKLWDVVNPRRPVELHMLRGHVGTVWSVAFSPSGHMLATSGQDKLIRLWDITSPRQPVEVRTLAGHASDVRSVAISPDGRTLASASWDKTVRLWDVTDPRQAAPSRVITDHTEAVYAVAFDRSGRTLATAGSDRTTRLWDINSPTQLPSQAVLSGPGSTVCAVAFSPDGTVMATASHDGFVWLWDVTDRAKPFVISVHNGHTHAASTVLFNPRSNTLASGSGDETVRLWDMPPPALRAHTSTVYYTAPSSRGNILTTAGVDHSTRLWDIADPLHPKQLAALPAREDHAVVTAINPAGTILAAGSASKTARLWDIADPSHPKELAALSGDGSGGITSAAFNVSGTVLATASFDGSVRLWDIRDPRQPKPLPPLSKHSAPVKRVAFNGGSILASGSFDRTVRLQDVTNPNHPRDLSVIDEHTGEVWTLAFSPDGRTLATGSYDSTVRLFDITDPRRPVRTSLLKGHMRGVFAVAFSPDGRTLATGSIDNRLLLWDLTKPHQPSAQLLGHTGPVESITFRDDHTIVSSSADNTVRFWETDPDRVARRICDVTHPKITQTEWERYFPDLSFAPPC